MSKKQRLDLLLVERGLAESRSKAEAIIRAAQVLVDDFPVDKPGTRVSVESELRIRNQSRFVGRGGDKIDPIFDHFKIDVSNLVAIDIGASTGGFTDSMLQRGATRVYAVDVGFNQLAHRLRTDPRVVVMEKVNARDLSPDSFSPQPAFGTIDVSFIGVTKLLRSVLGVMAPKCSLLVLVKPQFELSPEHVSRGGVVTSEKYRDEAVRAVVEFATDLGLSCLGTTPAALRGQKKGNQEFFAYFHRDNS